ncbi:hypothetical protein B0H19DRAFT_1277093 [Mycena capillaripes]|nr:hypothetical protein B0H19DRAFT_1277093 [Mycena capillaripes]
MTVAVYEGDEAEAVWYKDITPYLYLRHPNVVQLYGIATSGSLVELASASSVLSKYGSSAMWTIYFYDFLTQEFENHGGYISRALNIDTLAIFERLFDTASIIQTQTGPHYWKNSLSQSPPEKYLLVPEQKSEMAASLSLEEYHIICAQPPLSDFWLVSISDASSVRPGSIINRRTGAPVELAFLADCEGEIKGPNSGWGVDAMIVQSGWIRISFLSPDRPEILRQTIYISRPTHREWLSQANSVFSRLGIASNFDDYVSVDQVHYIYDLLISETTPLPSTGFLFLPPHTDLLSDSGIEFGHPNVLATEATELGFPVVKSRLEAEGSCWDASIYKAIREFHQAKGFDADSQDVARHLEYPLFHLVNDMDRLPLRLHQDDFMNSSSGIQAVFEEEDDDASSDTGPGKGYSSEEEIILYPRSES